MASEKCFKVAFWWDQVHLFVSSTFQLTPHHFSYYLAYLAAVWVTPLVTDTCIVVLTLWRVQGHLRVVNRMKQVEHPDL